VASENRRVSERDHKRRSWRIADRELNLGVARVGSQPSANAVEPVRAGADKAVAHRTDWIGNGRVAVRTAIEPIPSAERGPASGRNLTDRIVCRPGNVVRSYARRSVGTAGPCPCHIIFETFTLNSVAQLVELRDEGRFDPASVYGRGGCTSARKDRHSGDVAKSYAVIDLIREEIAA
jgi:hypothetical protein